MMCTTDLVLCGVRVGRDPRCSSCSAASMFFAAGLCDRRSTECCYKCGVFMCLCVYVCLM